MERVRPGGVWEFYGSTEAQFSVCAPQDWLERPGTVGRARHGRRLRIEQIGAEAGGAEGTIWCDMPEFARFSYWENPEATAAAWNGEACTVGDLGRLDPDGFLYLTGRRHDLIISGGVNVYPAEVENVLAAVDGIAEVAVFGVPDDQWGQKVCAAYVTDGRGRTRGGDVGRGGPAGRRGIPARPVQAAQVVLRHHGSAPHGDRQAHAEGGPGASRPAGLTPSRPAPCMRSAASGQTGPMPFATINPATGKTEKEFPAHTPEEVEAILAQAMVAFADYRTTSYGERARHLITAAELLESEVPDIARILTTEMGKTFAAAKAEVSKCAAGLRWFAENSEALLADQPIATNGSKSYVHYQPLGAVLAIMPWNFPLWQVIRFAAPALMVGNVGLLKHASNVPQTALALEDLFRRAGLPDGAFSNLFVPSKDIAALIHDPRIAAVTLTGSEPAGMSVAAAAGDALKKTVLELGGSDPFVVLASADLDDAVRTAVTARVQNNGQSCIASKRFIVVDAVADEFESRFIASMDSLVVGDPFDPATNIGPIVTETARDELVGQVEQALEQGATVHAGAKLPDGDGWWFAPTVLSGVTTDMPIAKVEMFGPVAMVIRVPDVNAAIAAANDTSFGLGSSVWGADEAELAQVRRGH